MASQAPTSNKGSFHIYSLKFFCGKGECLLKLESDCVWGRMCSFQFRSHAIGGLKTRIYIQVKSNRWVGTERHYYVAYTFEKCEFTKNTEQILTSSGTTWAPTRTVCWLFAFSFSLLLPVPEEPSLGLMNRTAACWCVCSVSVLVSLGGRFFPCAACGRLGSQEECWWIIFFTWEVV